MSFDDGKDLGWEKPAWAKGGTKLRSTGKADVLKQGGSLAAPITDLPHMKGEGEGNFSKPEWTDDAAAHVGQRVDGDLAKPITNLPHAGTGEKNLSFEKPDWTKKPVLSESEKGAALKQGAEIARPIGGIKPVEED